MVKYLKSSQMAYLEKMNGGILYLLPDVILKICTLIALTFLWRTVMSSGADVGMTMAQMLTYTYVSSLLGDLLVVKTAATGWLSEGVMLRLYGRPQSVLGQLIAVTAGGWIPMLLLFSAPMLLIAPLLGISLRPASLWFFPSLVMCVSLGFAMDILFACLSMKLHNTSWLIDRVRAAIVTLLSGTVIPIALLPFGIANAMQYQPFACLGGATLSLFVGSSDPLKTLSLQLFWNAVMWAAALYVFRRSQEGMVSYGG